MRDMITATIPLQTKREDCPKLLSIEPSTDTYKELCKDSIHMVPTTGMENKSSYWTATSLFFGEEATSWHRISRRSPCSSLWTAQTHTSAIVYCLWTFVPYIDKLNAKLNNRFRSNDENEGFYTILVLVSIHNNHDKDSDELLLHSGYPTVKSAIVE